ncbi:InlB B-repeat-containing protein [Bacillus sp. m3-13]|uniref:InlB B-repeat-containing protein n=1 Tax=Bacillus sp. m3-13 TaxID=406124 RepID=UPI0001E89E36|nr:InlB B-repeat-containing protein [Bacillus sp. m3-13]
MVAEAGTITKEIEIQVSEQVVESIDFIVEDFDSLAIGQELGLEITGLDADGNEMILNPTWKIKKDLGTLTSNNGASNSFTANKVGLETITVEYQGLEQHMKVLIDGEGHVVNFNVVGQGQATISPAKDVYDEGDEITIEAVPEPGWKFIGWEGDITDTINPLNLTIIENLDVTAIFEEEEDYELTINREGEGEIIRSSLSDTFAPSENVTLTASPADGWEFARWEGSVNTYTESITVKMDSDKELTAVFRKVEEEVSSPTPAPPTAPPPVQTPTTYTLSTSVNEGGSVNHNGGGSSIKEGTTVTLTATPYDGWEFVRWEGSASGSSSTVSITMNENKSVRAIFTKKQTTPTNYSISTSTSGDGSISKNLSGSTFVEGTVITLTASAAPGWEFVGWEGDSTSTSPSISITLTRNMSVVAVFKDTQNHDE